MCVLGALTLAFIIGLVQHWGIPWSRLKQDRLAGSSARSHFGCHCVPGGYTEYTHTQESLKKTVAVTCKTCGAPKVSHCRMLCVTGVVRVQVVVKRNREEEYTKEQGELASQRVPAPCRSRPTCIGSIPRRPLPVHRCSAKAGAPSRRSRTDWWRWPRPEFEDFVMKKSKIVTCKL